MHPIYNPEVCERVPLPVRFLTNQLKSAQTILAKYEKPCGHWASVYVPSPPKKNRTTFPKGAPLTYLKVTGNDGHDRSGEQIDVFHEAPQVALAHPSEKAGHHRH